MPCVSQDTVEADACRTVPVNLGQRDLGLGSVSAATNWNASPLQTSHVAGPTLGRDRRKPTMTGTSPDASVVDTSVRQLAFLPSAEAYCGATPKE